MKNLVPKMKKQLKKSNTMKRKVKQREEVSNRAKR
jgi:hypothetical protein